MVRFYSVTSDPRADEEIKKIGISSGCEIEDYQNDTDTTGAVIVISSNDCELWLCRETTHCPAIILIQTTEGHVHPCPPELNPLAVIRKSRLALELPLVITLIKNHPEIIDLCTSCGNPPAKAEGFLRIGNDPAELSVAANIMGNILQNFKLADTDKKENIIMALLELLINSVEHGHCKITYQEKTQLLESGKDILAILREKIKDESVRSKNITLVYRISSGGAEITVNDEGKGFDWKKQTRDESMPDPEHLHGRGIAMAKHYLRDLHYNDAGNSVTFRIG
jgi:hypothetical protein